VLNFSKLKIIICFILR